MSAFAFGKTKISRKLISDPYCDDFRLVAAIAAVCVLSILNSCAYSWTFMMRKSIISEKIKCNYLSAKAAHCV